MRFYICTWHRAWHLRGMLRGMNAVFRFECSFGPRPTKRGSIVPHHTSHHTLHSPLSTLHTLHSVHTLHPSPSSVNTNTHTMNVVFAQEGYPATCGSSKIFLAGPTVRRLETPGVAAWREDALEYLTSVGYTGEVYVPEERFGVVPSSGEMLEGYTSQIEWEEEGLERADVIVFWIPRDLKVLPGFTTNDEWGYYKASGKVVMGYPPDTPKVKYQTHYAHEYGAPVASTLHETLDAALAVVGPGAVREGVEASIPLRVWATPAYKAWAAKIQSASLVLRKFRVVWSYPTEIGAPFVWAAKVCLYSPEEDREKSNEIVIGRPDVSSVVMLTPPSGDGGHRRVVVVRELRSAGGMVTELPGGSTGVVVGGGRFLTASASGTTTGGPSGTAVEEVAEEVGIAVDAGRLVSLGSGYAAPTMLSHATHGFLYQMTAEETAEVEAVVASGEARGVEEDGERTYVGLVSVGDVMGGESGLDLASVGLTAIALSHAAAAAAAAAAPAE